MKPSFIRVKGPAKRRKLIICTEGQEDTGKSTFALSAPPPVGVLDLDVGLGGVIEEIAKTKEIWHRKYAFPLRKVLLPDEIMSDEVIEAAKEEWSQYLTDYEYAIREYRSVVLDTATEMRELMELVAFGRNEEIASLDRKIVNTQFREMVRMADDAGANLIMVHTQAEKWGKVEGVKGYRPLGRYERRGFPEAAFRAEVRIVHTRDDDGEFCIEIKKCRPNNSIRGVTLQGKDACFPVLASWIWPDTAPEDWERPDAAPEDWGE